MFLCLFLLLGLSCSPWIRMDSHDLQFLTFMTALQPKVPDRLQGDTHVHAVSAYNICLRTESSLQLTVNNGKNSAGSRTRLYYTRLYYTGIIRIIHPRSQNLGIICIKDLKLLKTWNKVHRLPTSNNISTLSCH